MSSKKIEKVDKTKKVVILLSFIFFCLSILFFSVFRTITEKRHMPSLKGEKTESFYQVIGFETHKKFERI